MDAGLPLGLSLQIGARYDCGGQYRVTLVLMEDAVDLTNVTQHFVPSPSRYFFHSDKLKTTEPAHWRRCGKAVQSGSGTYLWRHTV